MHSLPTNFYEKLQKVRLERTAVVTGCLGNPMDLVYHSRPWWMVTSKTEEKALKTKTLIFADHFFKNRDKSLQDKIGQSLSRAKRFYGAQVMLLGPDGELEEWDDNEGIARSYQLDIDKFPTDHIKTLAWEQQNLTAEKTVVLDYFGINELLHFPKYEIRFVDFYDKPKDLVKLIENNKSQDLILNFSLDAFRESFDMIRAFMKQCPEITTFKNIKFKIAGNCAPLLFEYPTDGKVIELRWRYYQTEQLFNLPKSRLSTIKKLNLDSTDINATVLSKLLQATTEIEEIILFDCTHLQGELNLPLAGLKHLKMITANRSSITTNSLSSLLKASPNLEHLELRDCKNINDNLDLTPGSLKSLKTIILDRSFITAKSLSTLLKAAPNLENLDFEGCKNILEDLDLTPGCLTKLKKINGIESDITAKSLSTLLKAAPAVEKIYFNQCKNIKEKIDLTGVSVDNMQAYGFYDTMLTWDTYLKLILLSKSTYISYLSKSLDKTTHFELAPNSLSHIIRINFQFSDLSLQQLITLLRAAPKVTEIVNLMQFFPELDKLPHDIVLPNVQEVELPETCAADQLTALLRLCPNITSLKMPTKIVGELKLPPRSLPFLTRFEFLNCKEITMNSLINLFNASPALKGDIQIWSGLKQLAEDKISGLNVHWKDIKSLYVADIHQNFLYQLLNATSELDKIACSSILGKNSFNIPIEKITHLKNLSIRTCDVNTLLPFLQAPQLEELRVNNCEGFDATELKPNSLKNLKVLTTSNDLNLESLFRAAPILESLSLTSLTKNTIEHPIPQLKALHIGGRFGKDINAATLSQFLTFTPNIESLSLEYTEKLLIGELKLAEGSLKSLKKINVGWSVVNTAFMETLLKAAPNIEILEMSGCKNINIQNFNLADNSLPKLKEIFFPGYDEEANEKFRKKVAPHIKPTEESKSRYGGGYGNQGKEGGKGISDQYANARKLPSEFFDTRSGKHELSYTEYFPGVHPAFYRLRIWQPNLDTLNGPTDLKANDYTAIPLEKSYDKSNFIIHKGIKPINPAMGNEIILPSLDPEEKIYDVKLINEKGKVVKVYDKIDWSNDLRFGKITLPKEGNYTIHFKVAIPHKKDPIPDKLQDLVNSYANRPTVETKNQFEGTEFKSLGQFAEKIKNSDTGSCLHRSIAAYAELSSAENWGVEKTRICMNGVHAFIEVKINDQWHILDLGGQSAELKKTEEPVFQPKSTPKPRKAYVKPPEFTQLFLESKTTNDTIPVLVKTESNLALQNYLSTLSSKPSDIFMVNQPEDLTLTASGMTEEGKIIPNYTRLKTWLTNRKQGIICVDIRHFNDSEIAQLNDLLDRNIEKQQLPTGIRIKIIDHPNRQYGLDFKRRVPTHTTLHNISGDILTVAEQEDKEAVIIDLFRSPYWKSLLLGTWKLKENPDAKEEGFSFYWQQGPLLKSKEAKKIVFKNPPLDDPSFMSFMIELQALRRIQSADPGQSIEIAGDTKFSQSSGYDWKSLATAGTLHILQDRDKPLVLTDANVLSFIQSPRYQFSKTTNKLELVKESYLELCKGQPIDIVCSPNLSEDALALFMTKAKELGVKVRFLSPSLNHLPQCLANLYKQTESKSEVKVETVIWQTHQDLEYAARKLLHDNKEAIFFDMTALEPSELGRYPHIVNPDAFLKKGLFTLQGQLSPILKKLMEGKTVILSGKIPPTLYGELTALSLGKIEDEPIKGKLIMLTPPEDMPFVTTLTGQAPVCIAATAQDKMQLLQKFYPEIKLQEQDEKSNFTTMVKQHLKSINEGKEEKAHKPSEESAASIERDKHLSDLFDQRRLDKVQFALKHNTWVMLPGPTAIGKSYFLDHIYPQANKHTDIKEWLKATPKQNENVTLVIDEASFSTQLRGEGVNFFERFKSLRNQPPGFLYEGTYYELTPQHKIIFAFNPASYGAGRTTEGFLANQELNVSFEALPDYYIRARVIDPLFKEFKNKLQDIDLKFIEDPIMNVYRWIARQSTDKILITARQIKAMVHLIVSEILEHKITHPTELTHLANEVAFMVGKQAVADDETMLAKFEKAYPTPPKILGRKVPPKDLEPYQYETWGVIQSLLNNRKLLTPSHTDMGLGGVLLEGGSGIGKTHFINQIANDYQEATQQECYRISPSTPYFEKEKILQEAFDKGALVLAEEINTSLWPNKLLNNFLMGLDKDGKPANKPGFMLLATQNPPSFAGRVEEDPALRQRLIKLKLDWPVHRKAMAMKAEQKLVSS